MSEKDPLQQANQATKRAYAPYSMFRVGAAVLLDNGEIITGSNQENAAYPSGLCAERVVLFYAGSKYPDAKIKSLAIAAVAENFEFNNPVTPCGACRQVMSEYEQKQNEPFKVLMQGNAGKVHVVDSVSQVLPLQFKAEGLKKE